ncbi:MAG: fatty acid desaturase family protein [Burkholderiaceae bacterium]
MSTSSTTHRDFRQLLPREELLRLQRKSAWRATWMLAANWGLIVACFALVIWRPEPLTVLVAILVLGGRQLGLGVLMHECGHRSFMPSAKANEWVGHWLCAAPMYSELETYRSYHMTHHVKTGTEHDPDLANYSGYPVSAASFARKVLRDLIGLTGVRAIITLALLYSHADPRKLRIGYAHRAHDKPGEPAATGEANPRSVGSLLWNARRILVVHAIAISGFVALNHPLVYLLWPAAWLTTYMLYSRIRNAAEHGGLPGTMSADPLANTRTVVARWWERLTVAPNFVNFHFEHHLAPTVPSYNLAALNRYLRQQGVLERVPVEQGYVRVVQRLVSPA